VQLYEDFQARYVFKLLARDMFYSYLFKEKVVEPRMFFSDPTKKVSRKLPEVKKGRKERT
jgi:hypothetical protein